MFRDVLARLTGGGPAAADDLPAIVLTAPPHVRQGLLRRCQAMSTFEAIGGLCAQAHRTIEVFSPYVDPTFTSLLHSVDPAVAVRVVTTAREGRGWCPNPVLERCAMDRRLQVRYLIERRHQAQMFQMHAKLVRVDARCAYVGSANLTDTSLHYNLELGILMQGGAEVAVLGELFEFVWNTLSTRGGRP